VCPLLSSDHSRVRQIPSTTTRKSSNMDIVGVKPRQLVPTVGTMGSRSMGSPASSTFIIITSRQRRWNNLLQSRSRKAHQRPVRLTLNRRGGIQARMQLHSHGGVTASQRRSPSTWGCILGPNLTRMSSLREIRSKTIVAGGISSKTAQGPPNCDCRQVWRPA
jgi:hypothetical protein